MIEIKRKLILEPKKENEWESQAVLNPTSFKDQQGVHLIYRAVRYPNYSSLGYALLVDGTIARQNTPFMVPEYEWEKEGVEDPRITKIDSTYYMLYTAWDGQSARVAYAQGKSIFSLEKKGIISPSIPLKKAIEIVSDERYRKVWSQYININPHCTVWDKDAALLPEKIDNKFVYIHRLDPDIHIVKVENLNILQSDEYWEEYLKNINNYIIIKPKYKWEGEKIGLGPTPIKVDKYWLLIYHGVEGKDNNRVYSAGAMLLDENLQEVSRLSYPLFKPEYEWEKRGDVNNVVFPEGLILEGDNLVIFYGCADSRIGKAEVNLIQLMQELLK